MKTHQGLFEQVSDFHQLHQAFVEASHGKRHQAVVRQFEYRLEDHLIEIKEELEQERFRWGAYHAFWISDPKRRLIHAAPFRDRLVHHALNRVLEPIFDNSLIFDTYACRKGKGALAAVHRYESFMNKLQGCGHVLTGDIHRYFATVDHAILKALGRRKVGDQKLLRLLDSLIDSFQGDGARGIPIGNLTSQLFANIYLNPLDHFIKEQLRQKYYIRYMDDFVIPGDISGA